MNVSGVTPVFMPLIVIGFITSSCYTTSMEVVWQVHLKGENGREIVDFVQAFS